MISSHRGLRIAGWFAAAIFAAPMAAESATAKPPTRWYPAYSGNYTKLYYTRSIRYVIIHTIEGSASAGINWFRTAGARVSAHYVVDYNGAVTQMVLDNDRAWHAAGFNSYSIGIENAGYSYRNYWTTTQYKILAQLTAYLCERYRIPKTRTYILPHSAVTSGKSDPGAYFNWTYFMSLVLGGSSSGSTTTSITKAVKVTASTSNVRTGPSTAYSIQGTAAAGQIYVATASSGGWYQIGYNGQAGWIIGSNVTVVTGVTGVKVTSGPLNVRTGPGTGYAKLGEIPTGGKYVRAGTGTGWTKIWFKGGTGWVNNGYISTFGL